MRSVGVAYILWFFLGISGVHRFYCGKVGTGFLWFFTGGLLGVGWLIDAFLIPDMVQESNWRDRQIDAGYPPPAPLPGPAPPPAGAVAAAHRVLYCTRCGGAMQVPASVAGRQYACPSCRAVFEVPA